MKLHGEYSTSAGIKQVLIIEGITELDMCKKLRFPTDKFDDYLKGKRGFSVEDLNRFEGTYKYMNGRIRW